MKTLELEVSENLFEQFEKYRRGKQLSRTEALGDLLKRVGFADDWRKREPTRAAAKLSEEEVERLAVEGVREGRRAAAGEGK
jgi:hypothetical protein